MPMKPCERCLEDAWTFNKEEETTIATCKMCGQETEVENVEYLNNHITKIYTDGATYGQNGKLGTVYVVGIGVYIPDLNFRYCQRTNGISNNEAEFKALIAGMEIAIEKGLRVASFNCDSLIVINRANGSRPKGKFKNLRMDAFQDKVLQLKKEFKWIEFKWIKRDFNTIADELSKEAFSKKKEEARQMICSACSSNEWSLKKADEIITATCKKCTYETRV